MLICSVVGRKESFVSCEEKTKNDRRNSGGTLRQKLNLIDLWHLIFDTLHLTYDILHLTFYIQPMDQWINGPILLFLDLPHSLVHNCLPPFLPLLPLSRPSLRRALCWYFVSFAQSLSCPLVAHSLVSHSLVAHSLVSLLSFATLQTLSEEGGLSMQSCKMSQIWLQIYLGKIFGGLGKTLQTVFEEKASLCARLMTGNQFEKQPKTGNKINHAHFSSAHTENHTETEIISLKEIYLLIMFSLLLQNCGWLIFWKATKAWWLWFSQRAEKLWR